MTHGPPKKNVRFGGKPDHVTFNQSINQSTFVKRHKLYAGL